MTSHFEELSIITGTREMSGLAGDDVEEPDHRRLAVEHGLVHVDINDLAPLMTCCRATSTAHGVRIAAPNRIS